MNEHLILLVTKEDFESHVQVSQHGDFDRFMNPHILNAQLYDLRPVLGHALFAALIAGRNTDNYKILLNGGSYTYNNYTYFFEGIRKALVHYAFSRYALTAGGTDTPTGLVKKKTDFSEPLTDKEITRASTSHLNIATAAMNDVVDFLQRNISTYPEYGAQMGVCEGRRSASRSGIKISSVSRN